MRCFECGGEVIQTIGSVRMTKKDGELIIFRGISVTSQKIRLISVNPMWQVIVKRKLRHRIQGRTGPYYGLGVVKGLVKVGDVVTVVDLPGRASRVRAMREEDADGV
ncbi:MAG: YgiT-type zinc finger protein [Thermodesulfobacteriota bacterium]|nr:YgiT-type zinc finger protein [Thermodesulfobacteriota bacterium]